MTKRVTNTKPSLQCEKSLEQCTNEHCNYKYVCIRQRELENNNEK